MTDNELVSLNTVWLGFLPQRHYVVIRPITTPQNGLNYKHSEASTTAKEETKTNDIEHNNRRRCKTHHAQKKKRPTCSATSIIQQDLARQQIQHCETKQRNVLEKQTNTNAASTSNENTTSKELPK